jgi:hypothetical protein
MENNKVVVTVIDGAGIVEAKNDRAQFTFSVRAKGDVLETAVSQAEEKQRQALSMLESFKDHGMVLDGDVTTSVSNYKLEHREGSERFPAGFQSVSTITFNIVVDDKIDDIYKACLKFDTHMSRPIFNVKDRDILLEQALVKASENVKEKLAKECSLLGVATDKLRIQNWNFGYEGYLPTAQNIYMNGSNYTMGVTGVVGPTGPQGSAGPVGPAAMKIGTTYQELLDYKIEPGAIAVRVAVRVNYVWND